MAKAKPFRVGAVVTGAAFLAGWTVRALFPRVACPQCDSTRWRRLGGGLKQCRACSYKFFAALPAQKAPPSES